MKFIKKKALEFLAEAKVARVATVSRRGMPQVTPVCHVVYEGKIYFVSDYDTRKLKNLKKNRREALVADRYMPSWRNMGGVMVQGRARVIKGGPLFQKISQLLYPKYPPYRRPEEAAIEGKTAIVEIKPTNMVTLWFD